MRGFIFFVLSGIFMAQTPFYANADLRIWNGTGNWNDTTYWSGGMPPESGDDVLISTGNVTITNTTPYLRSLTNHAIATFTGTGGNGTNIALRASQIYIANGANITHSRITTTNQDISGEWIPDSRVWIICTNCTVAEGGSINVDTQGFLGGDTYNDPKPGKGPGGGGNVSTRGGGGGHGGAGAPSATGSPAGITNGSFMAPVMPGSGGGSDSYPGASSLLGSGGGAIYIQAANYVTVDGTISADGAYGGDVWSMAGGGAGGSIYIDCKRFAGSLSGDIHARGGNGTARDGGASGSGGGGRIAIYHQYFLYSGSPNLETDGTAVNGGINAYASGYIGDKGTVYWKCLPGGTVLILR